MYKYKIIVNGAEKVVTVSDAGLARFQKEYPDAVLYTEGDFQNGDVETDASATPVKIQASNGGSSSADGLSDFNARARGDIPLNSYDPISGENRTANWYKSNPKRQRPTESFPDFKLRLDNRFGEVGTLSRTASDSDNPNFLEKSFRGNYSSNKLPTKINQASWFKNSYTRNG